MTENVKFYIERFAEIYGYDVKEEDDEYLLMRNGKVYERFIDVGEFLEYIMDVTNN